jgi:hypothetical protein
VKLAMKLNNTSKTRATVPILAFLAEERDMDQLHHHKAKSGFEFPVASFNPEDFVHQWQARASRLLHAQERIAQGLAAAARAQLRYGQEYMVNHINMLHWDVVDAEHLSVQARKDIEGFAALIKEISSEIRDGFTEANELLEAGKAHKPQAPSASPEGTSTPVAAHPAPKAEEPPEVPAEAAKPVAAHKVDEVKAAPAEAPAPKPAAVKAAPASMKRPASRAKRKA